VARMADFIILIYLFILFDEIKIVRQIGKEC
jgi:hypothetical protein